MPLCSMTGFGREARQNARHAVVVEVQTVNHRYLKPTWRVSEALSGQQARLEQIISRRLQRGSVLARIRLARLVSQQAVRVDAARARAYQAELSVLGGAPLPMSVLCTLPGVIVEEEPDRELADEEWALVEAALETALDQVIRTRQAEGAALHETLTRLLDALRGRVLAIAERAPSLAPIYRDKLTERVGKLLKGSAATLDSDVLAREVALYADRIDIAEELQRLDHHITAFRQALDDDQPVGRKLDFWAQEMLREANTIGSKAQDAEVIAHVVALKSDIERVKEQVQNVE